MIAHSGIPSRILVLALALTALAGCNSGEEEADAEPDKSGASDGGGSSDGAAPTIWGDPATSIAVGSQYVFLPETDDADGDVLTFEIANKPAWAEFNTASGQLRGIPGADDAGSYANVIISVTDGSSVASLASFAIAVNPIDDPGDGGGGDGGSAPPGISGQPNEAVVVDTPYTFQPQASDPDGDTLSFSLVNRPSWASFSTETGRIEGTPTSADLGTTAGIELSVTDGGSIDSLNPFSIAVVATGPESFTVSWTPPTLNDDGSTLTDLAGYKIYYGTVPGDYNQVVEVNSAGVSSYPIDNMVAGTYYLVMTSVNAENIESVYSAELRFELGS